MDPTAPGFNPNIIFEDLPKVPSLAKTHGILMGLTFVLILPMGAVFIRIPNLKYGLWLHIACQLTGWVLMIAGLAMGIKLGNILDLLENNGHTIVGTIVVAALLIQPILGYIHHRRYLSTQRKTMWTHIHVNYGRIFLVLGIVNGGLGLKLASDSPVYSKAGTVTYSVLAVIAGIVLFANIALTVYRQMAAKSTNTEEVEM